MEIYMDGQLKTLNVKICKMCGGVYFNDTKKMLELGDQIEIIECLIKQCLACEEQGIDPRRNIRKK